MKLKNRIINYFVALSDKNEPLVYSSSITMSSRVAKVLLESQLKREAKDVVLGRGSLLHVCYDLDSEMIYVVNSGDFSEEKLECLLIAAKLQITKDFGNFSSRPPIKGSPYSSIRVRSINSFSHAKNIISKHYKGKTYKDIPIIEAFLPRMPSTVKTLPSKYKDGDFSGGYISPSFAQSITFVEEMDVEGRKRTEPQLLLVQKAPFILINIAQTKTKKEPTATEKEWIVLEAYRDYLNDELTAEESSITEDITKFADLYAIKRALYMGWPIEEVSDYMLDDTVQDFGELIKAISLFMSAVSSLKEEGYNDVAVTPYYLCFKIDDSFPLSLSSILNKSTGEIDRSVQYDNFMVLDYDHKTQHVLIRTSIFVSPHVCKRVLKAQSAPFIVRYNHIVNKIDIKSDDISYKEMKKDRKQLANIHAIISASIDPSKRESLKFRNGELASGESSINPNVFTVRRISEYLYASDFIKIMCEEYGVPFEDFDVVVGPIERVFGERIVGGFMDKTLFTLNKWPVPKELQKGIWVSPPFISISSLKTPSYHAQTDILIHEYAHYIYSKKHPDYKISYGGEKDARTEKGHIEQTIKYLSDVSEEFAYLKQMKFELGLGKSPDEIIRDSIGGALTLGNYPIALKYREKVEEALKEIEGG